MSGPKTSGKSGKLSFARELGLRQRSLCSSGELEFGFGEHRGEPSLVVLGPRNSEWVQQFDGEQGSHKGKRLLVGPISTSNTAALRVELPWLRPRPLGVGPSVGLGDRLGLATPGHVRALRAAGGDLEPAFAQQSIREMGRTGRGPQEVMDDATWGVFSEGWREGFGADADHLKTPEDVDACLAAGYTMFTFDPGAHVDDGAENAGESELQQALERLPWNRLEDSPSDLGCRYLNRDFDFDGHRIAFDERTLYIAAVKYGWAVVHAAEMYRYLKRSAARDFEVEVSVDETAWPTTHAQHVYLASELRRLGVEWVSLAPRYVGAFEKGVDYIGDLGEFEADFAIHAAIARGLGPYKLSLHSGSDKFSVYPVAVEQTRGLVHLKTAGTSHLEALRTTASLDPGLFREIYDLSRRRYEEDRESYHVSASLDAAPRVEEVSDADAPALLEQFDAREILHVTFGSLLGGDGVEGELRGRFMALLRASPEAYAERLESHFLRHLEPFAARGGASS